MNNHLEDIIPLATMLREYSDELLDKFEPELKIIENRLRLLNQRLDSKNIVDDTLNALDNQTITYPQAEQVLKSLGLHKEERDRLLGVTHDTR